MTIRVTCVTPEAQFLCLPVVCVKHIHYTYINYIKHTHTHTHVYIYTDYTLHFQCGPDDDNTPSRKL